MGYLAVWKTLEEMITSLRAKGKEIPTEVMSDLKATRTLIRIVKTDGSSEDIVQKVEEYLNKLESYVVSEAEKESGSEYVNDMLKRLVEARKTSEPDEKEEHFAFDIPRDKNWIRVKPTAELTIEKLQTLAGESEVKHKVQNDGSLLVYGKNDRIGAFIKKMATEYGLKTEK